MPKALDPTEVDAKFVSGDVVLECIYRPCSRAAVLEMSEAGFSRSKDDARVHARLIVTRTASVADLVRLHVLSASHVGWTCELCLRLALPRATFRVVDDLCKAAGFAFRRGRGEIGGWVASMTDARTDLLRACAAGQTIGTRVAAHRDCVFFAADSSVAMRHGSFVLESALPESEVELLPEQKRAAELMRERRERRQRESGVTIVEPRSWV